MHPHPYHRRSRTYRRRGDTINVTGDVGDIRLCDRRYLKLNVESRVGASQWEILARIGNWQQPIMRQNRRDLGRLP